ncbi:MAG TPA: hypothetical protein VET48_06760 [Steroidobacteraceae bacterium]|nr:hypothetical protein [Steroidobacteraceae bacterium]
MLLGDSAVVTRISCALYAVRRHHRASIASGVPVEERSRYAWLDGESMEIVGKEGRQDKRTGTSCGQIIVCTSVFLALGKMGDVPRVFLCI